MTVLSAPPLKQRFYDTDGVTPLAGGRVFTYATGTTTPQATYSNRAGTSANSNPIILDSNGEAVIYLLPGVVYDFVVQRPAPDNTTVLTRTGISAGDEQLAEDGSGAKFLVFDPTVDGPRLEIQKHAAPTNYTGTKATFVLQYKDDDDAIANEGVPGAVFLFTSTGDGVVSALPNLSSTIWQGALFGAEKFGDGSQHAISVKGQLQAAGAVGYNELGLISGDLTNLGSMNGYIVGTEWLLKDGTGAGTSGVNNFPTAMSGYAARIAKYSTVAAAPTYPSVCFLASSEGTQPVDSIVGINNGGLKQWLVGIDLRNGIFTSGAAIALPNAAYLHTNDTGGTSRLFLGTNAANSNVIYANGNSGYFQVVNGPGTKTLIECNDVIDSTNPVLLYVNGALKRVTVDAADSAGVGFRALRVPN